MKGILLESYPHCKVQSNKFNKHYKGFNQKTTVYEIEDDIAMKQRNERVLVRMRAFGMNNKNKWTMLVNESQNWND